MRFENDVYEKRCLKAGAYENEVLKTKVEETIIYRPMDGENAGLRKRKLSNFVQTVETKMLENDV